jgi:uncharacterized protein YcbK (DUF882 family)
VRLVRALRPAAFGLAAVSVSWCAQAQGIERTLTFYNIHTKETVTITYKRDGAFLPEGMKQINNIMRDWRREEPTEMDPELIDTIWEIYQELGSTKPIHLVSGYRSKRTNERLRRRGGGQARKSQHILGKAADIHLPDVSVKKLRNSALVREAGGVGYYPKSGLPFVHVDTGRVRHWPKIRRQELAALFPDGKSQHVPSDGRPITSRDSRIALAKLDKKIDDFIARKSKIKLPPKMMMAGFTPPAMKWPKADTMTTASIPLETPPAPPADASTAALEPPAMPAPDSVAIGAPVPVPPQIAIAALEDAEHPEELSYKPYSMLPLMNETSISADRYLAQLRAPGTGDNSYLLRDPEGGYSASLARGLGYTQELKLVSFGVRKKLAAKTPRAAKKRIRTASR